MTQIKEILEKLFNIVKKILGLNPVAVAEAVEKKVLIAKAKGTRGIKKRQASACKKTRARTNKRCTNAMVDSINMKAPILTSYFNYNENYKIETVKRGEWCDNNRWQQAFGKSLFYKEEGRWMPICREAYIVTSNLGCIFPMKMHNGNKGIPTIEFAGLVRYDERSELLKMTLKDLVPVLADAKLARLDICIDIKKRIQSSVTQALLKKRKKKIKKNTTYYVTSLASNRKNDYIKIYTYDKGKKEGMKLEDKMHRLEFSFGSSYLKNIKLKDIHKLIPKMEKTINSFTGLNVKISLPF